MDTSMPAMNLPVGSGIGLEWRPPKGADMQAVLSKIGDVGSWWSHATAAVLVVLLVVIALLSSRPTFIMETNEDGLMTDNISVGKLFGSGLLAGGACLALSLWVHGIPS